MQLSQRTIVTGETPNEVSHVYDPRSLDRNRVATYQIQSEGPLFGRAQFTYMAKPSMSATGVSAVRIRLSEPIVQTTVGAAGVENYQVIRTGRADVQFGFPVKATAAEKEEIFEKTIALLQNLKDDILKVSPVFA